MSMDLCGEMRKVVNVTSEYGEYVLRRRGAWRTDVDSDHPTNLLMLPPCHTVYEGTLRTKWND